jgi:hypothetical protein
MTGQAVSAVVVFGSLVLVVLYPLIQWLDKPVYLERFELAYWCVLVGVLSSLSMIPHYALYAIRHDTAIVVIHLTSLPLFVLSGLILAPTMGGTAIPIALSVSFFFICLAKTFVYVRACPSKV